MKIEDLTLGTIYELCLLRVLYFDIYVLIEIINLHWRSRSHRL